MTTNTGFSITYEIITHESAENGECAEEGFILQDVSLKEAMSELRWIGAMEASNTSDSDDWGMWFLQIDPNVDMQTGAEERWSFHVPRGLTPSTRRRIARLVAAR